MKKQENKLITLKRRRAFAWIACFVLLFGMLAMPMTPTMPRTQGERVVWGSFCTANGPRLMATSITPEDQRTPDRDDHAMLQHCPCCSGALSLVAVPAAHPLGFLALIQPVRLSNTVLVFHAPPHVIWPSRNPRASPRV